MRIDTEEVGLLTAGKRGSAAPVPLTGVKVRVVARGPFARVTVTQDYVNREAVPVEAVYVFPLEEGSAVCGFTVLLDGKRIVGRVMERDAAFDRYDDAMISGDGAFLLDQERPNIFTASVGNLMPGKSASIELSYLTELAPEGEGVRLSLPTTVSPRYHAEDRRDFPGMTDAERVSPPVSLEGTPYRLDLEVTADLLSPLVSVESPSHKIRTELDGSRARITLAGDEGALDRDFVLILTPAEPFRPIAMQARDEHGDRYALVSFRPEFPEGKGRDPVEVIFLVDCSGSMDGDSIAQARRALLLCLQSLIPGDRFNVVRFGSTHEMLFPESAEYTDRTLAMGRRLAEGMDADLGGTEILRPLTEVTGCEAIEGLPRRVVLLTDGQVSNESDVIRLAGQHRSNTRIFAFGIGAGSSEYLVRGVARASGGAAEFVHPGETIEAKVLRHFERIAGAEADLTVSFTGFEVTEQTPEHVPALATGEFVTFAARIQAGTEGRVRLRGSLRGKEFSTEVAIPEGPGDPEADTLVPLLFARRRIRDLEERMSPDHGHGSAQVDRRQGSAHDQLVRLGTRFGLMSSATSFVAIEERADGEKAIDRAELRRIPVSLTQGFGGARDLRGQISLGSPVHSSVMRAIKGTTRPAKPKMLDAYECREAAHESRAMPARYDMDMPELMDLMVCMPAEPAVTSSIFFQQNADGSWDLTDHLARECGGGRDMLERATRALGHGDAERILATQLVLLLAERLAPEQQAMMKPMLDKAKAWLRSATSGLPGGGKDVRDWARKLMR